MLKVPAPTLVDVFAEIFMAKGWMSLEGIMRCPHCNVENKAGRRFCSACGQTLSMLCPHCGFVNDPGDQFCGKCGQVLSTPTTMSPQLASLQSYTPKHLAEKILTSRGALEGERKQVTTLFADLKVSMGARDAVPLQMLQGMMTMAR